MEPGSGESLPTLQKLTIAQDAIMKRFLHGQNVDNAKSYALDFANAYIEDLVFNKGSYANVQGSKEKGEEQLRSWQEATEAAGKGDNKKLKEMLLEDARLSLQTGDLDLDPKTLEQGLAFLNLLFSIPDQDQS